MNSDLVRSRSGVYGDPLQNMIGTSQQIAGILTQALANGAMTICCGKVELQPSIAPLIMVAVKLNRSASGIYHKDNLDDAENYWAFAQELQKETGKVCVKKAECCNAAVPLEDSEGLSDRVVGCVQERGEPGWIHGLNNPPSGCCKSSCCSSRCFWTGSSTDGKSLIVMGTRPAQGGI